MKHPFYLIFTLIITFSFVGHIALAKKKDKNGEVAAAAIATALIVAAAKEKQEHKNYRDYRYNHWDNRHHGHHDNKSEKIAAGVAAAAIATAVVVAAAKNKQDDDYRNDVGWDPVYKTTIRRPRHDVKCFDNTRACYWTTSGDLITEYSKEWTKTVY